MKRLYLAVGLHSVALIALQIELMQILSIVQWYHFAFMIISVALLGFGASGMALALLRERMLTNAETLIPFLMIATGFSMSFVVGAVLQDPLRFDSYLLFADRTHILKLLLTYFTFFIPFFLVHLRSE